MGAPARAGEAGPPTERLRLLARALLTAIALVVVALPALAVAGAWFPSAAALVSFGRLVVADLGWLGLGALVSCGLLVAARALGGGRLATLLLAGALAILAGAGGIGVRFAALAADHGGSFDVLRQASTPPPLADGPDEHVGFTTLEDIDLYADVWRATGAAAGSSGISIPPGVGVVFVHGGSFAVGGLGARPALFAYLASIGVAVVDIEYRLAPPPRWQDAPADVACALAWLSTAGPSFGIDPERVVLMGESAGGNLALLVAYDGARPAPAIDPSCPSAGEPLRPIGAIGVAPVTDLAATWGEGALYTDGGVRFPEAYVGGPPDAFPDRYRSASPIESVVPGLPPTLLVGGVNDQLVRIEHLRDLAAHLVAAGNAVTLVEIPFADHGFDGAPNGFGQQLEEALLPRFLSGLETGG